MDRFSKIEVEKWVSDAYDNVNGVYFKTEALDRVIVKHEVGDDEENDTHGQENVHHKEYENDDSIVNIAEYFDLESLVKEQIELSETCQIQGDAVDLNKLKRKVIKDELIDTCIKALEKSVANIPEKVRGLPLHGFVFTRGDILEAAKAQVTHEKTVRKSEKGRFCKVSSYSCKVPGCQFTIEDNNGIRPAMSHVMAAHMEQKAFMCKGCGLTFPIRDRVYSHIRREHVEKKIKSLIKQNMKINTCCKLCGNNFRDLWGLRSHIKNVHEKLSDVKCPECSFVSKDYMEVRNHRRNEHGYGLRSCHICGKQFTSVSGFNHHLENTHGDGNVPCPNCGEIFKTKKALDDHWKRKHIEKTHVCDECGAKFHTPGAVRNHKKWHTNEYPFPCKFCDKKYKESGQLKTHMYKHTGERPYRCKQCEATFTQTETLNRHMKVVHAGIRAYPCEFCSFQGGQAYDLVRHKKSVHNINNGGDVTQLNH